MSNNNISVQGEEAADPAATPNQPSSSSSLQPSALAGGLPNALNMAPPIPVFNSPAANGFPPAAVPAALRPAQLTIEVPALARLVASMGIHAGARVAAMHHKTVDPANPLSIGALLSRVLDAPRRLTIERFCEFDQGSPNAVAIRLLAPRRGPSYPFDRDKTAFTKPNGMVVEGRKCGHPTCEYRNADRSRHMQEMHVREIATALCCPVCEHVFYDAGRDSEMRLHIRGHERGSALVRRRGREALMGCYSIDIPDDW